MAEARNIFIRETPCFILPHSDSHQPRPFPRGKVVCETNPVECSNSMGAMFHKAREYIMRSCSRFMFVLQ